MLLGVDLGTSHTVAMLRRPDGRTRPLLFDGRPLLPSAVYLDTTGRLHVGPDALRLGHADPGRLEPHPKRHIDEETVLLGDAEVSIADLLAAVLGAVAREAVATAGFLPPAVLTFPVSWGAPRRGVLIEALGRAGWPRDTQLIPEPVAAARYFADVLRRPVPAGSSLAVFDFGGGTLDVAVARNDGSGPARFAVTASGGDDNLGGLDLDAALVDHLSKSLSGGEPQAWRALTAPATLAQWRARREFWENVRGAKEMLSRSSFAPVPVPGVEQAVQLTRDELEAAAGPLVRRAVAETRSVIAAAGVAPADLAGLFLVGGSSRVPLVARLLHSELGIAPTVLEQPEFPVAEGATLVASAEGGRFMAGVASAATPTPTPVTVADVPPPITDTRADSAPITPTMPGWADGWSDGGAPASAPADSRSAGSAPVSSPLDSRFGGGTRNSGPGGRSPDSGAPDSGAPDSGPPGGWIHGGSAVGSAPGGGAPVGGLPGNGGTPASGPPGGAPDSGLPNGRVDGGTPVSGSAGGRPNSGASANDPAGGRIDGGSPVGGALGGGAPAGGLPGNGAGGNVGRPTAAPAPRIGAADDRVYGEPVDPWASGEAAAIAAGGHGLFPSSPVGFHETGGGAAGSDGASGGPRAFAGSGASGYPGGSAAAVGGFSGAAGKRSGRAEAGGGPGGADGRGPGADGRAASESGYGGGRRKAYVWIAGAVAALLVIGGVSVWHFWPGYRGLDYQTLSVVKRVAAAVPVSSSFVDAEVIGERVYFASSDSSSGRVGVVATGSDASKAAWSSLEAGVADRWESMTALPGGVALLSAAGVSGTRRLAVLGAKDGHLAWWRAIGSNDDVYFVGDMAVLADDTGHQLIGLRQSDGSAKWRLPDPKTDYSSTTSVFVATTKADLNGPATVKGQPLDPDPDDDTRIVQVSADRAARVIDAETGKVQTEAPGVAGTGDEVVAHDGRLIVRQSEGTQRVVSYNLDKLGEPKVLYTAQSANGHLSHLTPCGERVCFVEDAGYDDKTDVVTAVDAGKGGRVWHQALAGVDGLVPAGPDVLAGTSSQTTLLDDGGKTVWTSNGVAARLDGGNLLEFAKPLSSIADDPAVAGQHLGHQPVQMGPLSDVRTDTCSWNKSVIACVADKDFVILKFAK